MGTDYITITLSHAIKIHIEDLDKLKSVTEHDMGYENNHFINLRGINQKLYVLYHVDCLAAGPLFIQDINCGHQALCNFEEIENNEEVVCKYKDYIENHQIDIITNRYNVIIKHLNQTFGTTISDIINDDILVVLTIKTR